jgi:hypothetical protein
MPGPLGVGFGFDLLHLTQLRRCAIRVGGLGTTYLTYAQGASAEISRHANLEAGIMRYELTEYEWAAIKPMLPKKPRGVPRVNDHRVLNGIFWVLRSGAPWRDLPQEFGPYTTCYNRFVRWRRAGVWRS